MSMWITGFNKCDRNTCPKIINMLFDASADKFVNHVQEHIEEIEMMTSDNVTVLLCAAAHGKAAQVRALLSAGANVNHQDGYGRTALMFAAHMVPECAAEAMRLLLQHPDINVNLQDEYGTTALMYATCWWYDETTFMLLQHPDINVNLQDNTARTALMFAARTLIGHTGKTVHMLLQHPDIDINLQDQVNRIAVDINVVPTAMAQIMCLIHKIPSRKLPPLLSKSLR